MHKHIYHISSILLICIASILLQIAVLAALPRHVRENEGNDYSRYYAPVARNLLDGKGLLTPEGEFASLYPPGYPITLAGVSALGRGLGVGEELAIQAFSVLSSTLAAVLIFLIARGPFGGRVAVLAALLWVTYPYNTWLSVQRYSEQPFILVLLAIVSMLLVALESQRPRHGLGYSIGVLIGIAALIRAIALALSAPLILMPLLARTGWTLRRRLFFCGALLLGNLVALVPWEYWAWRQTGRVILGGTEGPVCVWDGLTITRCTRMTGVEPFPPIPTDVKYLMEDAETRRSELNTMGQIGSFLESWFRERPSVVVKLLAIKATRSWYAMLTHRFEVCTAVLQSLYLSTAIWGLGLARARGTRGANLATVTLLIGLYFWAMTIVFLSLLRYTVPAMSLLLIFSAVAISRGYDGLTKRRPALRPAVRS
jgi:Dolichyl-phosphate-mannose-protein mannosyltransferase